MGSVSEAIARRTTLGYLAEHYGCELVPTFAGDVTVTSLADDVRSITPGTLFVPSGEPDAAMLARARQAGAYAVAVPPSARAEAESAELPMLVGDLSDGRLGAMAGELAGSPASSLAVFAMSGDDRSLEANARRLARLLHMLGNPVALIGSFGSASLEREMELDYPMGPLDVQRVLALCQEDGVAAAIVALDDATLRPMALSGVTVDVLGSDVMDSDPRKTTTAEAAAGRYGFVMDEQTHLVGRTGESDQIAMQFPGPGEQSMAEVKRSSLAVAMVMAAGVRKNNIRNALRVSHDLGR